VSILPRGGCHGGKKGGMKKKSSANIEEYSVRERKRRKSQLVDSPCLPFRKRVEDFLPQGEEEKGVSGRGSQRSWEELSRPGPRSLIERGGDSEKRKRAAGKRKLFSKKKEGRKGGTVVTQKGGG